MGVSCMGLSSAKGPGQAVPSGNPNPNRFKILSLWPTGHYYVSMVQYSDCANYEGLKILVTRQDPSSLSHLDPHFTPDHALNAGLIARFEPTVEGEQLALKFAQWLSNGGT